MMKQKQARDPPTFSVRHNIFVAFAKRLHTQYIALQKQFVVAQPTGLQHNILLRQRKTPTMLQQAAAVRQLLLSVTNGQLLNGGLRK